ncbi:DUF1240 domain-containing protein [Erwinia endophytica]|uniref:DUF1240 domain-containing protein n=1 Tax=Erwinia endophytica TaxID=1563158 RepID=UPI001265F1E7|nr:DUF1240 domain-containing protein [Erwinia endophytica]KAB8309371.1 DUF1240 domain-containing protein [Erwinia endophytica]
MSPKRRFIGTLIIWCVSSFGSLWFANDAFSELFYFGSDVVFSPTVSALLMIPIILLFPCIYWYLAMRHGEEQAIIKCKNANRVFIGLVGVFFVSSVIFSFAYTSTLTSKGYVKCAGRPDGWMPGMATKYVLPPSVCGGGNN